MDDKQMEQLIESVRENERRTQNMSETLLQFNESFGKMLDLLGQTTGLNQLQEGTEKVHALETTLEKMNQNIVDGTTYQEKCFEQLEKRMLQANAPKTLQSEVCVQLNGQFYMVTPTREQVIAYNKESSDSSESGATHSHMVQMEASFSLAPESGIKQLLVYEGTLYVLSYSGILYNAKGEEVLRDINQIVVSSIGIFVTGQEGELRVYRKDKTYSIATQVENLEVVDETYLIYQKAIQEENKTSYSVCMEQLSDIEKTFTTHKSISIQEII